MDDRKEWDELVEWISKEDPPTWKQRNCILWADARIKALEEALRSIAGAVGEFASADGKNIVEKIEFLRKDYEDRIKALEEAVEWAVKELMGEEFNDGWWNSGEPSYLTWVAKELRSKAGRE